MSEKITFKELVEQISNQSKQSQNSTNSFIHELVQIIESGLRKNGSVSISGFGKFELKWMKERSGRNPQTGEELTIPGQNKVVFKPYKALREDVNRPYLNMKPQVLQSSPSSSESSTKDEDKKESKPPEKTPIEPATPAGKIDAESVDEDDEWVFERPKPENIEPKETEEKLDTPAPPEPKISEEKTTTAKPDDETSASKKKLFVASTSSEAAPQAQKDVKKSDRINWTYAAATVIIALAVLLILFLMQHSSDEPSETALNSGTQDQIESVEQPPAASDTESGQEEAETEPEPVPEAETDEEDPNDSEIITHDVQRGDTLWSISDFRLGNAYLWPWIFRINSSTLDNPNHLQSGSQLSVPYVSNHEDLSDNQLEQVARGYLSVYEWFLQHNPEEAKYFLWAVGVFSMDVLDQAADNIDADDLAFAKNR